MTFPGRIEMAKAPDREDDPASWTWTDITADNQAEELEVTRGRSGPAGEASPGRTEIPFSNSDGRYSPFYPASTHHPDIVRGLPVRVSFTAGDEYLATTGAQASRASTPDAASLDITGDMAGVWEFGSPVRHTIDSTHTYMIGGKYVTAGNQRSWFCDLVYDGNFRFFWSTDGTVAGAHVISGTVPIPRPDAGPLSVGFWFDVNLGGTSKVLRIYVLRGTKAELLADLAGSLWETITEAGTTSIFASTAALDLGGVNGAYSAGGFENYPGAIRRFELRNGDLSTGTIAANPDFTIQTAGAGSFTDTAAVPKVWTINAPAVISGSAVRFLGELAANKPDWPGHGTPGTARVTWEVAGPLRRMRQGPKPLHSALRRLITAPINAASIIAYWPWEDGSAATSVASPIEGVSPISIGGTFFSFGADTSLPASSPLARASGSIAFAGLIPDPGAVTQYRVDIFARINTPAVSPAFTYITAVDTTGTAGSWTIGVNDTDVSLVSTSVSTTFSSDARFFNTWVLWSLNVTQNGGNVDWALSIVPTPLGLVFGTSGSYAGVVGVPTALHNWLTAAPTDGISFGHMVVSTGNGLGWLAPADTAYAGEPATSRFYRLCREQRIQGFVDGAYGIDWPDVIAAGGQAMGPQRPLPFLDLLGECATVDHGYLGESREVLGLTYRAGSTLLNQTPALTAGSEVVNPLAPADDDQRLVNDVIAKKPEGSEAHLVDAASIEVSGLYDESREFNVYTDDQLPNQASWRLTEATREEMRYPSIPIELTKTPALITDWLTVAPGALVVADSLPSTHSTEEVRQLVDGYRETMGATRWHVAINGTPAGMWEAGVRDDADLGIRDTGGSVVQADFDAGSDTTLEVATTLGPLWADTAASNSAVPFDLDVGGYRVAVSAIAKQHAIAFGSTGTVAHANNASITPALPASVAAGNLLLAWTAIRNTAGSIAGNDQGYTELVEFENVSLWGKIAGASESAPTFTISGGVANADVSGQIVRFTGTFHTIGRALVGATALANASAQDIAYRGLGIGEENCLVVYLGWKQDDWTSVATIAGATEIGEPDTTTGDDQGIVWDYLIETAATDIADGSFVVTGGAAAVSKGLVVALRSSVQAFTVSATVWPPVAKTLPAGTAVSLWRPARRSL